MSEAFDPFDDVSRASWTAGDGTAIDADESATTRHSSVLSDSLFASDLTSAGSDEEEQDCGQNNESKVHSQFFETGNATHTQSDMFQFSVKSSPSSLNDQHPFHDNGHDMFPSPPTNSTPDRIEPTAIHVALHEQLTTRYEGNNNIAVSHVEGSIHVRAPRGSPFTLAITDANGHIEILQEDPTFCIRRRTNVPNPTILLTVALPSDSAKKLRIASYLCTNVVRPIPFLVKSKVLVEGTRCRVGVKIRSNPTNRQSLTQISILMAVPPDIRGETVKLTRRGGVWDEMKRVVAWPAESLSPGDLIEIQAQFNFVDMNRNTNQVQKQADPTFPILVRCEGTNDQFSDVQLGTDESDDVHTPVKMSLTRSVLILHRRV